MTTLLTLKYNSIEQMKTLKEGRRKGISRQIGRTKKRRREEIKNKNFKII